MIKWLKSLLGIGTIVPHDTMSVEEYKQQVEENNKTTEVEVKKPAAPKKKTTTKKATKKKAKVDLDSMKKNELLAHAKANGIKANASMNKAAILEAIKNG